MNLICLGKLIDPKIYQKYINVTENFETIVHKYGTTQHMVDYPHWMEYKNEGGLIGSISFTRNTHVNKILNKMCINISETLKTIFFPTISIIPERVHIIRTSGSIPVHRDESYRKTCINIGLKNSNAAITDISIDGIRDNFNNSHASYILEDGYAYIMNTNSYHAVNSINNKYRYLITYGFKEDFDYLTQQIIIKENKLQN